MTSPLPPLLTQTSLRRSIVHRAHPASQHLHIERCTVEVNDANERRFGDIVTLQKVYGRSLSLLSIDILSVAVFGYRAFYQLKRTSSSLLRLHDTRTTFWGLKSRWAILATWAITALYIAQNRIRPMEWNLLYVTGLSLYPRRTILFKFNSNYVDQRSPHVDTWIPWEPAWEWEGREQ